MAIFQATHVGLCGLKDFVNFVPFVAMTLRDPRGEMFVIFVATNG